MSVAIAMEIGSPNSRPGLVRRAISSIMANIGTREYKVIIGMIPSVNEAIRTYVYGLKKDNPENIELMPEKNYYWADFINTAIDMATDFKYFLISHDDIELLTPDFMTKVEGILQRITEPVGWVSFTDKDYLNGHFAPPVREGWHIDSLYEDGWNRGKLFQFHSLPDNWWRPSGLVWYRYTIERLVRGRLHLRPAEPPAYPREYYENLPYDYPFAPVKCHAPFSHFILIEMSKLKEIGRCVNWECYAPLLIEEDWGLRALQLCLNNIWIPDIAYSHYRPGGGSRASPLIAREGERIQKLFFEKWGFHPGRGGEELKTVREKYKNTYIPWSIDRRSYEWEYIR